MAGPTRFRPGSISTTTRNDVNVELWHDIADGRNIEFVTERDRF